MQQPKTLIIKRTLGYSEPYDERKLYASVYASCLSVRTPIGEAEVTADKVCKEIREWLAKKQEVTSGDLRRKATERLEKYNQHAAYIFKHHRLIS